MVHSAAAPQCASSFHVVSTPQRVHREHSICQGMQWRGYARLPTQTHHRTREEFQLQAPAGLQILEHRRATVLRHVAHLRQYKLGHVPRKPNPEPSAHGGSLVRGGDDQLAGLWTVEDLAYR